jgi:hypothetical protein
VNKTTLLFLSTTFALCAQIDPAVEVHLGRLDDLQHEISAKVHAKVADAMSRLDLKLPLGVAPQLKSRTSDPEEDLKVLALSGLIHNDPEKAAPVVEQILKGSGSPRLKERALQHVAKSESPKSRELMEQMARGKMGDAELQARAIRYLGHHRGDSQQVLREIYASASDAKLKRAVVDALHSSKNAGALVDLARKETDPQMKREIVGRLSRMQSKEANDYLMEILK